MDNIFDGVNDGVNDGGGNPTFNSKRTVSKEEQARILQAVKDTAQNNANREPINLKPVTIKAKKPLWANLEEKYTNEELAKLNANKNWGAPTKLGDVVQRRAATNAARDLIAQKYPNLEKDIEKNRVATLNKMLPKERELIERSDYASKIATTYGEDFRQGATDFSELFTPAGWGDGDKRIYDPSRMTQEEANNSSSWGMLAPLSVPSKVVQSMYKPGYTMGDALSGKKNNADGFEDIATDLAAWTGVGAGIRGAKLAGQAINASKESGLLSNAYKLNSYAKTELDFTKGSLKNIIPGDNPEYIQRGIASEDALNDLLNTGIVRNRLSAGLPSKGRWGENVYWGKKGDILASNRINIIAKNSKNLVNRPVTARDIEDILIRNNNGEYESLPNWRELINKPHWLKGYKEVPKPNVSSSVNDVSRGFKSEIDWGKWNKEIPENTQLMQEYNTIEQTSKANGNWMKNSDGFDFVGTNPTKEELLKHGVDMTPEQAIQAQFIQQNSKNIPKNVLRNADGSVQGNYHASKVNDITEFKEEYFNQGASRGLFGKGNYTTKDKISGEEYKKLMGLTSPDSKLYSLYINSKNPASARADDLFRDYGLGTKDIFKNIDEIPTRQQLAEKYNLTGNKDELIDKMLSFKNETPRELRKIPFKENDYLEIKGMRSGQEQITPYSNYLKSAIGNNGMFDMTNPNIYKSIIGAGTAGYLTKDEWMPKMQDGGEVLASNSFENNINIKPEYVGFLNEAQMMQQNRDKYWNEEQSNSKLLSAKEKLMNEQNKYNQQSEFLKEFGINNKLYGK